MEQTNNIFIRDLYIRGFKSIKYINIELKPINVIIGANGAGKSNMVSVFDLMRHELDKKLNLFGNANEIFHFGTENTENMMIRFESEEVLYDARFEVSKMSDEIICNNRRITALGSPNKGDEDMGKAMNTFFKEKLAEIKTYHFHNTSPKSVVRSLHGVWDNVQLHPNGANIASILYKIKSYGIRHESYEAEQKDHIERVKYLRNKLSALEADYWKVRNKNRKIRNNLSRGQESLSETEKEQIETDDALDIHMEKQFKIQKKIHQVRFELEISHLPDEYTDEYTITSIDDIPSIDIAEKEKYIRSYNDILLSIRAIAPYFDDFVLEKNQSDQVSLRWKHVSDVDTVFGSHQISDGTLRFILMAALFLQPNPPKVIVLDEPELGLHPKALAVLADIIQSVSKKTQIIMTTQSVEFANYFEPEDFIVADYENGETKLSRPNEEDLKVWLEEYGMGDIWCKNLIGGRP